MISFSTRFRLASIALAEGDLSAIILDCESKGEALRLFTYLSDYMVSKDNTKTLILNAKRTGPSVGDFLLRTEYDEQSMQCEIQDIEWEHIEAVTHSMSRHAFYLILAGYTSETGSFELLSPSMHHVFRSEIVVDDVRVSGITGADTDYDEVIKLLG